MVPIPCPRCVFCCVPSDRQPFTAYTLKVAAGVCLLSFHPSTQSRRLRLLMAMGTKSTCGGTLPLDSPVC